MKATESQNIFGSVLHISKPEYAYHVTEASKNCFVILLLYQDYLPDCKLLQSYFKTLAELHQNVKFVKIIASQCIDGFPDKNCPGILVYGNSELKIQLIGMKECATIETIETVLLATRAIVECKYVSQEKSDDEEEDNGYY